MATLGRPRADFYRFFDAPERHRKINGFCNRPKSPPELQKSLFGHPRLHFWWIFVNCWCPFWHHFLMFLQNAENLDFGDSSIDFKVFSLPKHLLQASFFYHFSKLFLEPLLDRLFGEFWSILNQKWPFLTHLAAQLGPQMALWADMIAPKIDFWVTRRMGESDSGASPSRSCAQRPPKRPEGSIFVPQRSLFHWFGMDFHDFWRFSTRFFE